MCVSSSIERFFHKLVVVAALVSMAAVFGAGATHAMPAYIPVVVQSTSASSQGGRTVGSILTATTAKTFNSLGFVDVNPSCLQCGPDGLLGSYQVGIWLVSTQTLLASAWVQPSSPLGAPMDGSFMFRWASIPTVTIPAGQQFIIAALLPASPLDAYFINDVHVNDVGIVGPGTGRFEIGGTLSYPSQTVSPFAVYSVANASTLFLPEPTAATSILFGLTGLAAFRRHRRSGA
jgi:hypothetical protein